LRSIPVVNPAVAVSAEELARVQLDHVTMVLVHVLEDPSFRLAQRRRRAWAQPARRMIPGAALGTARVRWRGEIAGLASL
jgi:hypothetical protein